MVQIIATRGSSSFPPSLKTNNTLVVLDANSLSTAVAKVFRRLEPWYKASSDDKHIHTLIKSVHIQSAHFNHAISLSTNINTCTTTTTSTDNGLQLLASSALFVRAITSKVRPIEEMQPDFGELVRLADEECERLLRAEEILGVVARRFRELGEETGPLVAKAMRVPNRYRKKVQPAEGLLGVAKTAGGAMMYSTMPPLVTFPLPLEEPREVKELGVSGFYKANAHRDQENVLLDQALSRLRDIANDVTQVKERMTVFVNSWRSMKQKLTTMQEQMRKKDVAVGERLGNEVEGDWADVVEQYKAYKAKVNALQNYYQSNFQVDCSDINFTTILQNLRENAGTMRTAISHMDGIVKLTHSGEGRRQFQTSIDAIREKLSEQFAELIPMLEEFQKSVKSSGSLSDIEPAIRQELVKLLGRTETYMPLAIQDIHKLMNILEEQVSTKRLYRAQFYHMFSSGGDDPGVYSQEDAMHVLTEFGEAALGVSRFCEVLILVGVVVDEAFLLEEQPPKDSEGLEKALGAAIRALSAVKEALCSNKKLDFL